jgi:S-DNA-T family DNA segregation ATPase FtsK/SpoIIIE
MVKKNTKNKEKLFGIDEKDLALPDFSLPEVKPISISGDTRKIMLGAVCIVASMILILGPFGKAGKMGTTLYQRLWNIFGIAYPLLPFLFLFLGIKLVRKKPINFRPLLSILSLLGVWIFLSFLNTILPEKMLGGRVGNIIANPLSINIGRIVGALLLASVLTSILLILRDLGHIKKRNMSMLSSLNLPKFGLPKLNFSKGKNDDEIIDDDEIEYEEIEEEADTKPLLKDELEAILSPEKKKKELAQKEKNKTKTKELVINKGSDIDADLEAIDIKINKQSVYVPPPLTLLEKDKGKPAVGDIKTNSLIIKRTLMNFGIDVEMDEVTVGPTVTRYALKPAEGIKLAKIVSLQQDLSLALAVHPLRIEAPIPGKSLVGIEIPNKVKSMVGLASLFADESYSDGKKPLLVALGRSLSGKSIVANLAKMPHALIAGTTGSGKSVTIHTLIMSLLYRNGPDALRFIFVDPKRVELTLYNGIPHLLSPVITDSKKAIMSLKWAAKEMDRRYDILENCKVRDIESYHNTIVKKSKDADPMPYIVVVIDELADLMQAYPRELEAGIVRLAQMSRAVGIHLVLSTQRPSVEVITGLIKANIPTRVALQVASQIDSRTILDQPGAEKLLGRGDMLYLSSESPQPERLQSAFISEDEVKSVVAYLKQSYADELPLDGINFGNVENSNGSKDIFTSSIDDAKDDDDEMYEMAKEAIIEAGRGSTSYLQRKLKLGYARAARLMDMLEERGVIGPSDGAKPREVLVKRDAAESAEF